MRFGRPTLGMLLAAFTITIRTDSAILIALLCAWWLFKQPSLRTVMKLGLAILPSLLIASGANYARYHSVLGPRLYRGRLHHASISRAVRHSVVRRQERCPFSPTLILGFLGWKRFRDRLATRIDASLFLAVFTAELLVYSKWEDWSSDDAWGVRFMIPAVVLMCIPAVEVLERRLLVAVVAIAGITVQVLAVSVGGLDYLIMMRAQQSQREALFVSGGNRVDFETSALTHVTAK